MQRRILRMTAVICKGLAQMLDLSVSGRRSQEGAMLGPRNDEWLNGADPALLAALCCNSDVQVPYRFPVIAETHMDDLCDADCAGEENDGDVIFAAQCAQDSQAGYCADYQNKRGPVAVAEVREWAKGQKDLGTKLRDKPESYTFSRFAKRLLSDIYGRGVVRGAVEAVNLLVSSHPHDVAAAETVKTADTESFFGRQYVDVVCYLAEKVPPPQTAQLAEIDSRNPKKRTVRTRDVDFFYGHRGNDEQVFHLSPYEFTRHISIEEARYPTSLEGCDDPECPVVMTPSGKAKLEEIRGGGCPKLKAGVDYRIKAGGDDWLPFPDRPATQCFRHDWLMRIRKRPVVPVFAGCPLPRAQEGNEERNAMLVMAYFHPWTLDASEATRDVPHARCLRPPEGLWVDAMRTWLNGNVLTRESARYINNFFSVTRTRQKSTNPEDLDCNSDDMLSDEELVVSTGDLRNALTTAVGGRRKEEDAETRMADLDAEAGIPQYLNSEAAMERVYAIWAAKKPTAQPRERGSVQWKNVKDRLANLG